MSNNHLKGVNMSQVILRLPQVKIRTGISRSSIYLAIKQGTFPSPIQLSIRSVGWLESDISNWINQRPNSNSPKNTGRRK